MPDNSSTIRVRRYRAHGNGDHDDCDLVRCAEKLAVWQDNEKHLSAVALFREIRNQGIKPTVYLGARYTAARKLASRNGYPGWCQVEPDEVHVLAARAAVKLGYTPV